MRAAKKRRPAKMEVLPPEPPPTEEYIAPDAAPAGREIVPYDPLQAYLREIRRHPPLGREEEHALAVRYREHKDIDAAYQLVTRNLWLAVKIARDYERAARSLLDLIQEGSIGLMEAVKNFDPYRGVRFPSYAVWWIRAYIVRYVIANWRMVKIGTTQAQRKLFFNLNKEKERLEREGFHPAPHLLAERLDVKESEVLEMEQRLSLPDVSVDAPVQSDSDTPLSAALPFEGASSEDLLAHREFYGLLNAGLDEFSTTLNKKERLILKRRLLSEEKATLHELAEELSLSRERIRQIENRIKEKLRAFLTEKYGTLVEHMKF